MNEWFESGRLRREDIFLTTKLSPFSQHPDKIEQSLIASLERLQVDYVDLYLIHYPIAIIKDEADEFAGDPNVDYLDLWKVLIFFLNLYLA